MPITKARKNDLARMFRIRGRNPGEVLIVNIFSPVAQKENKSIDEVTTVHRLGSAAFHLSIKFRVRGFYVSPRGREWDD